MSVFISYILLGLSLAAPIGPVNAAQLDRGIKSGFLHAWLVGVGAVIADAIYMLIVYLGVYQFIDTPFMKTFLWLFGSFVLLYTGIESLSNATKINFDDRNNHESPMKAFFAGFIMSITNPLTILFWLGIYGSVLANAASSFGKNELILYSSAIFIGLLLWDVAMATVASSARKMLTLHTLSFISILSGLSLIGFGLYFGYQGINLLLLG